MVEGNPRAFDYCHHLELILTIFTKSQDSILELYPRCSYTRKLTYRMLERFGLAFTKSNWRTYGVYMQASPGVVRAVFENPKLVINRSEANTGLVYVS